MEKHYPANRLTILLVLGHGRHLDVHKVVVDGRVEDGHLLFDRNGSVSLPVSVQTQNIARTVSEITSISVWDWGVSAN